MRTIRKYLKENDRERGKQLPVKKLDFKDLWAIGIFTNDTEFCSQFQKDLRDPKSGCKWRRMENCFNRALKCLKFVQKMG